MYILYTYIYVYIIHLHICIYYSPAYMYISFTYTHVYIIHLQTCVAVPLSPLNKREVLKTPYIQIWCRCGYISAPH